MWKKVVTPTPPNLDVTLSTATPSIVAPTPGQSTAGQATPSRIDFTSRKRAPTVELSRPQPYHGRSRTSDGPHDNYSQCIHCEGFHSDDESCGAKWLLTSSRGPPVSSLAPLPRRSPYCSRLYSSGLRPTAYPSSKVLPLSAIGFSSGWQRWQVRV
jgi:hypothetical protein